MTTITDIIVEFPEVDYENGENWAYAATDAWIAEARLAGLDAEEVAWDDETWEVDDTVDAGLVADGGGVIYVLHHDVRTNLVRAYQAAAKEEED